MDGIFVLGVFLEGVAREGQRQRQQAINGSDDTRRLVFARRGLVLLNYTTAVFCVVSGAAIAGDDDVSVRTGGDGGLEGWACFLGYLAGVANGVLSAFRCVNKGGRWTGIIPLVATCLFFLGFF